MTSERVLRQIERLLDKADEAIARFDWEAVLRCARAVTALDPENKDGAALLAAARRALEPEALASWEQEDAKLDGAGDSNAPEPDSAVPSTEPPDTIAGNRYRVIRKLVGGGRKSVYLAHDSLLDQETALTIINTRGLGRKSTDQMLREARAIAALGEHPGILPIRDLGLEREQIYLAQPPMPGGSLEEMLEQAGHFPLPPAQCVDIARSVCRTLEFAHSRSVIHGSLKPGNIWLASDGTVKIGDFSLTINHPHSEQEGVNVPSASYLSPEQAIGAEISPRADLYSLGAVMYEMVTGRPPFLGDDSVAIIGQHINTPPVALTWYAPQCPRPLESLILHLLAKDLQERPGSAGEVLTALESLDSSDTSLPLPSPQGELRGGDEGRVLDSLAGGIFVGRQRELNELKSSVEDTLSGMGRLIMLSGEPGIGKTRTAQELATYARLRGAQVMWGRCHEERGMPPYWPWVQALRSYVREQDARQLKADMSAGAADIAEIISDVWERIPGLSPSAPLEPDQARFRLFDSITSFLKTASQRKPLAIILDNLHWADNASLLLMQFLAQELDGSRVLLVGTYRYADLSRRHPLSQILGELTKDRLFQRVLLRGLTQEDVQRYIELTAGVTPPPGLVAAVYHQTEGNPLFLTEVIRLLVQEGGLTLEPGRERQNWRVRIPEGVREVIGRRLDRLSQRCNQILTIASVIGREFGLNQLEPLVEDIIADELLEVLEEALAARVVEELPQVVGRYQFCHTMIQQTLLEELSTTRKVRLHARIAEVLECLYGSQADAHADELIYHLSEAATMTGPSRLVHYCCVAGERALQAYAWEEALAYFQRALVAKEGQPPDLETAWLRFGLGRAQAATVDGPRAQEAVNSLRTSFEYYAAASEVGCAVNVAEYPIPILPGHHTGMARLISSALALVPPESSEAGRLLANYIRVLMIEEGDYEAAQDAYNRALRIARREGDEALEMRILGGATAGDAQYLRLQGTLVKSLRAIELAKLANEPRTEVDVRLSAGLSMWWMGDLAAFQEQARSALPPAERLRDRYWLAGALWMNEIAASLLGRWDEARQFNQRCLAVFPQDPRPRCTRALLEATVGDFTQAWSCLEPLRAPTAPGDWATVLPQAWMAMTLPMVARITGNEEGLDIADQAAHSVLSSPAVFPYFAMMSRAGLGLLAVIRNDPAGAWAQYEAISSGQAIKVPGSFMAFVRLVPSSFMTTARLLALLARTAGQPDLAASHFGDALNFCRQVGHRAEVACTLVDYADFLLASGLPDQELCQARSMLEEALAISQEMSLTPLQEWAAALLEASQPHKSTPGASPTYPDGLTQREVEVLRLLAVGKSNSEIATDLFISLRTVANHVTNIFNKISSANRTEAAIYASRQGLV